MLKYIIKRILLMIPVLLCIIVIVFTLMYFVPGDPALALLGESASEDAIIAMHEKYGLDRPFFVQLGDTIWKIFKGDFGVSYITQRSVLSEILTRYPTTLKLVSFSALLGLIIGVVGGIASAVKQYSAWDKTLTMFSLFGVSAPSFWVSMLLVFLFSVKMNLLPPSGTYGFKYWILPVFTLGLQSSAYIMRMTRSSMLEVIRQDYIRTARSKGQTEYKTIVHHALRNSLLPVITAFGVQFCNLLAGTVMVETIFSIPGISKFLIDSVNNKDFPCVIGVVVWIAINCVVVNLIVDIIYSFVDPRIKTSYQSAKRKCRKRCAVTSVPQGGGENVA